MGAYRCRCPLDEEGRLRDGVHDDRCPAGDLQDWAGRVLDAERKTAAAEAAPSGVVIEGTGEWVRVTFAEKPAREVLDALRATGFRWDGGSWVGERSKLPEAIAG